MIKSATILHLRVPFSFLLLPVFLFSAAESGFAGWGSFFSVFIILHLFLYPASNGYNSFFDRDEGSIGGLRNPPPVSRELYWVSLFLDTVAVLWGTVISLNFGIMLLIYGLVSKAYSHPAIRLKRYAVVGWLAAGFFQGYFTFIMIAIGLSVHTLASVPIQVHLAGGLSSMLLFGSYPMTQVYQHEEDRRRGDITMSLKLGVMGTFHFTAFFFTISSALFFFYFSMYRQLETALSFLLCLTPIFGYFAYWYFQVRKDKSQADFDHTMRLNFISALCLNIFFLTLMV